METQVVQMPKNDWMHYPFHKNLLESQGYIFQGYERPYDIWKDKFGNVISICESCGILVINDSKFRGLFGNQAGRMTKLIVDFLFNKKPTITNGNKQSDQSAG